MFFISRPSRRGEVLRYFAVSFQATWLERMFPMHLENASVIAYV